MSGREHCLFIVMERDCDNPFDTEGPIIMEQYINRHTYDDKVTDKAKEFADGGKYGRIWVGRVDFRDLVEIAPLKPASLVPEDLRTYTVSDTVAVKSLKNLCLELGIRARMKPEDVEKLIQVHLNERPAGDAV